MLWLATPKRWLLWDYDVRDVFGRHIGDVRVLPWRAAGTMLVEGMRLDASRRGVFVGPIVLTGPSGEVARATRIGLFTRRIALEFGGRSLVLRSASVWSREMHLMEGEVTIGTAVPEGLFSRRAQVELPDSLPVDVRLFVVWLVLYTWKAQQNASPSFSGAVRVAPMEG